MSEKKITFALMGNEIQRGKISALEHLLHTLHNKNACVKIEQSYYHFLKTEGIPLCADIETFTTQSVKADFIISVGGDGTFLKTAGKVGIFEIPMLGINLGRLGFLADVQLNDIERAIDELYKGLYVVENHSMIQVKTQGAKIHTSPYALNDISILKRDNASMITIHTYINGEHLITYQADGIIITTPTGSTAYNLSNGGPIIAPMADILCITPVAPHSLNVRPIVVAHNVEIKLKVESRSHNFLVAVDGRSEKMNQETTLTISKSVHNIKIVRRERQTYFKTLREKMMWGQDCRTLNED